ncbi:hypothetical protein OA93_13515 [Flavobacterium sp. KMS]|uniref:heme-binding protein n=1 Tax=Flavobacterium sp. KMS TaxID=1566023 RepID=UPI000580584A|nr:heme-binding protein [Flavobacterium sp. KMS]KIA97542.1 hypothetical protein OA93_13515 [Flavobacterium sp. KMS]
MENSIDLEQKTCPYQAQNALQAQQASTVALIPDITTPLVSTTNQPPVVGPINLGLLNNLIGTWNSPTGEAATGYNVMPLPQTDAPNGYITKNFPYFEEITFTPIAGGAPNRAGNFTQTSGVLFYEQRVYIANNAQPTGSQPIENTLIHAENGTWLYHFIRQQMEGPYGPGNVQNPSIPAQDPKVQYNKQISVPHGVSVLMVGGPVVTGTGNPAFPTANRTQLPFTDPNIIDPSTYLTNQLKSLNDKGITVVSYSSINVSSNEILGGGINNIHFEASFGKVVSMDTTWYIETLSNGTVQLQYIQNIILQFEINGYPKQFSHIDANTLQLVETYVQVDAKLPWQNTGITVQPGKPISINYDSGLWTADPATNNGNLYDANGYSGYKIDLPFYPLQGVNMGSLIGQVGTNPPFLIGNGPVTTPAGQTGLLSLCIDDDLNAKGGAGLADNIGSLQVRIKV